MAGDEPNIFRMKVRYTFDEAIEYMKMRDHYATTHTINWFSVRTGKPVCIGYN